MHGWSTEVDWRRVATRGPVLAVVVASHVALYAWLLAPSALPRLHAPHRTRVTKAGVVQVRLLEPPPPTRPRRPHATPPRLAWRQRPRTQPVSAKRATRQAVATPQIDLLPAPAVSAQAPAFVAGGDLTRRLKAAGAPPPTVKLPGGHQYTAERLQFIPLKQLSLEGKMNRIAEFLFGGFDPVCKNAQYELAKPRAQQIADGYTPQDLERLIREHCQ